MVQVASRSSPITHSTDHIKQIVILSYIYLVFEVESLKPGIKMLQMKLLLIFHLFSFTFFQIYFSAILHPFCFIDT